MKQRHADHLAELRLVPMPADSCAGPIFVDENLAKRFRRAAESRGHLAPQGNEKRRERRRPYNAATILVVTIAEAHHLAIGQKPLEVEGLERESAEFARERIRFFEGQNIRMIREPLRQPSGRREQIGLRGR
jgi:hypothetical protein